MMRHQKSEAELLAVIKTNQGIIYKICNSYCNNETDREDLAQEIVYQLLMSFHSFNDAYKFSTWMYRVALNVAISFYRKNKKENKVELSEDQHGGYDKMNSNAAELDIIL